MRLMIISLTLLAVFAGSTQAAGQNPQVMIRAEFIAVPKTVFDNAMRNTPDQLPSANLILGFKQSGQATVLHSPALVTQPGLEATVRAVSEVIYPTELEFDTDQPSNSVDSAAGVVVLKPACFETREVGVILTVLPELYTETDDILLTLAPEFVTLPSWKKCEVRYTDAAGNPKTAELEVPFFYCRSVSTTIRVKNGTTVIVGAGMNDENNENVTFLLITAQLLDSTEAPASPTVEEPGRRRRW